MRIRFLAPATLIIALHASTSFAQNYPLPRSMRGASAAAVVDQFVARRESIGLSSDQMVKLTGLADRLRTERGRLKVTNFDRVPGKSVPTIRRVSTTPEAAFRQASEFLTPEQQAKAALMFEGSHE